MTRHWLRINPAYGRGAGCRMSALISVSLLALAVGPAHRVKDITTLDPTVFPSSNIQTQSAGGHLLFEYFGQVWASDGTSSGTGSIGAARGASAVRFLGSFDGIVYFQGTSDVSNANLWRSDGTESGTWLVADLRPGSFATSLGQMVRFRGELYFGVSSGAGQSTLWKTDGTAAGTLQVASVGPDVFGYLRGESVVLGERLLFIGDSTRTPERRYALYTTDGTEAGTSWLADFASHYFGTVCAGLCPATAPGGLLILDGVAYFAANDGVTGLEPWRSDGTPQGTRLVRDITPGGGYGLGSTFEGFQVFGHRLLFFASDGSSSRELWTSDGTEGGTRRVSNLSTMQGGAGSLSAIVRSGIASLGNTVFFPGYDLVHGSQVWKTDGSEAGTIPVTTLPQGDRFPGEVTRIGDAVYFSVLSVSGPSQLWKIDAASSAQIVAVPGSAPSGLIGVDSALYFGSSSPDGAFLWKSDGSLAGSAPLTALKSSRAAGSTSLQLLGETGGKLMFAAGPGIDSRRLWKTDGTEGGSEPVGSLLAGSADGSEVKSAGALDGALVFSGSDGAHGYRLWRTDGTESGTQMLGDFYGPSEPCGFTTIDGALYFGERRAAGLWKTDGTRITFLESVQVQCSRSSSFVELNGQGFFEGFSGPELGLWKTDGTAAGTQLVWRGGVSELATYGGRVFFMGDRGGFASLFVTAGQPGDALPIAPLDNVVAVASSSLGVFALVAPRGYVPSYPLALWKTDGTAQGTVRLASWDLGLHRELVSVGKQVFLVAYDSEHGTELWVSDGTVTGTHIVKDIARGAASSFPTNLTAVASLLVFAARDALHGNELWRSDGTEAGTFRIQDIAPGPASSLPGGFAPPGDFTKAGAFLYFSADDGETGRELWTLPLSALDPSPGERGRETRVLARRH